MDAGRLFTGDSTTLLIQDHATHVAGTIIADGVDSGAIGMAPNGLVTSYDWDSDGTEMNVFGLVEYLRSNHSYGAAAGWAITSQYGWVWFGGATET